MFRLPKFYDSTYTMPPASQPSPPREHSAAPDSDKLRPADTNIVVAITLQSTKSSDRRTFNIAPGEEVTMGRASRSELKNLQASPDNALFDSPVVSRLHAHLRLSLDGKHVNITDRTSLHGTTVNGIRLGPGVPHHLKSGDVIKLGERVTRGADTHDGVALTFCLRPSYTFRQPSPNRGVFSVPSLSDPEGSDLESDSDSIHSYHFDSSSANTTPEHPKKSIMGSQEAPIDLDSAPTRSSIVDLSEEDDEMGQRAIIPESIPAPEVSSQDINTDDEAESMYLHNTGLSQILNKHDARLEEQDVMDLTNDVEDDNDTDSVDEDDDLDNGDWAANRPLSPELGDDEPTMTQPPIDQNAPMSFLDNFQGRGYDPVRNSLHQERQAVPTSTYTYGTFGYGHPPAVVTDYQASSRWDVPPQRAPHFNAGPGFGPPTGFPPISYGTDPSFVNQFAAPPPPPPPAPAPHVADPLLAGPKPSGPPLQPEMSPTKGRIAYIVDENNVWEQTRKTLEAVGGTKRKTEDDAEQPTSTDAPEAKKQKSAPIAAPVASPARNHLRPTGAKGRGTVRRLATHAASAALGGIGVIAFLNSDMSQSLINWLS